MRLTFLNDNGYLTIDTNGDINKSDYFDRYYLWISSDAFINLSNGFAYSELKDSKVSDRDGLYLVRRNFNDTILIFENQNLGFYTGISDYKEFNGSSFILINHFLIKITADKVITYKLPNLGLTIYIDDQRVLVGTMGEVIELDHDLKHKSSFIETNSVTSILKDNQNGFWFSTLRKGIFYTNNIDVREIKLLAGVNTTSLWIKENNLIIADRINQTLWKLSLNDYTIDSISSVGYTLEHKLLNADNKKVLSYFPKSKRIRIDTGYFNSGPISKNVISTDDLPPIIPSSGIFGYIEGAIVKPIKPIVEYPLGTFTSYLYDDSTMLMSHINGLYRFDFREKPCKAYKIPNTVNLDINQITKFQKKILLLSRNGLYIYHHDSISPVFKAKNIPFGKLNGMHIQNDSLAWIYGLEGVFELRRSGDSFQSIQLNQIPKGEVVAVKYHDGQLFVAEKRNLYTTKMNVTFNNIVPDSTAFFVDSVSINGIKDVGRNLDLNYHDELIIFF